MKSAEKHCVSCECGHTAVTAGGLKPREFAMQYHLSDYAVYQGIKDGSIPSVRVGRRYIVLAHRFEEMVSLRPSKSAANEMD